ncbi:MULTISPECIES: succinylglutamate desuccinylase/aspartoacylase family protein [Rhizobium]|uniref:succinylglutamate desuccinylase/aspartoacylase family protein n=1 Tax=Rhizobium TaxID=379 RepID=UPI0007EBA5D7|nr:MULTISPECIES: succinylglutamate desuccinylase/aspartoacylase family protein [Rhizobium]ANK88178.1 succinylglutamate desuccinylase/aspartoacylase protein [Rhizobium sp. N731]ANK93952.1 succinylglutamate desuccinylase/aspartoacylase protein [Rhizobium sp. N6212]ANL00003.1 succinylglutamate desuccinylase/aspartoacylase protein [Rhizobium sp. N621]ANL06132.1 succinylglutamate desuccinylase/aspartoacylase protein [Rhizobium esperanzae]ANL12297.1 succinylglutamate desuccinylase/aspartoacylase pro
MHSGLVNPIDFSREGRQAGHLAIPYSVDRSPYYQIRIPVFHFRNGEGLSLLLMAGNHGDEYEGELQLGRLMRLLDVAEIRGAVTILPMANLPAVMAAKRCSPFDGGNLNRAFPGDPMGSPTARMAHFLEHDLFPRHDVLLDLHSGGTSMAHLPCTLIERQADAVRFERSVSLMRALGASYAFIADNGPAAPTSMGAAARAGIIGLSGEFGGGGTVTPQTMAFTAAAIDRLLVTLGIVERPVLSRGTLPQPGPLHLLSLSRHSQGIYASRRGWFEPAVGLGTVVAAGDLAGWYHDLERLEQTEEELRFAESGMVISHRLHCDSQAGDCLIQIAESIAS